MSGIFVSITFIKCRDFSYWQAAPRLISPHHRHNLLVLPPRNILERILNLIHPHREKVDVHPASDDVIFRDAVSYTSFTDIIILSKSSIRHHFSLWSSLLGCWLPRFYGITCLMDLPICTCLACHTIRSISVTVTRTGHIHGFLPQILLHLGHHSVATFIPRSLAVHSLSISFHPSMCHYHGSILIIMLSQHRIGISYYLGCPTALGLV